MTSSQAEDAPGEVLAWRAGQPGTSGNSLHLSGLLSLTGAKRSKEGVEIELVFFRLFRQDSTIRTTFYIVTQYTYRKIHKLFLMLLTTGYIGFTA